MSPEPASSFARILAAEFRRRLLDEYVPRIRHCTGLLSEEQAWTRPGPTGNSVANLVIHLTGNVRQWILSGIGGEPDHRDRSAEFTATRERTGLPVPELVQRLEETARAAAAVVDEMSIDRWLEQMVFQQRYRETGVTAVIHVVEHFSGHAAQIYAFTKQTTGKDLEFHDL